MSKCILFFAFVNLSISFCVAQGLPSTKFSIPQGKQVVLRDTVFITKHDTVLILTATQLRDIRINESPYNKSKRFYDSLAQRASNSRVGKNIYDWVIRKEGNSEKEVTPIIKSENIFLPYEGYTIRSISFKAVDLLEGSVLDTSRISTSRLSKFVNGAHVDTRESIVNKNLLFKVGDKVDPFELADNERVLRQFTTLRDARIYLKPSETDAKTVDVVVVTQDVASIGGSGDYSSFDRFRLDVYDINILGYAKQFQVSYFRNGSESPNNGYEVSYRDPNFARTFLRGELQYTNNYIRQRTRFSLGRDFFTPKIKYAGGVELYHTEENYYFEEFDTLKFKYTENNLDVWAGRSFNFKRRSNFIVSARVNTSKFFDRPQDVASDSNTFFIDRTLILASATLTERNFMKGYRIQGFGKTEDVPVGASATLLVGKEFNEFRGRLYGELNGTYGRYFDTFGYISGTWALGSFFNKGTKEDGLFSLNALYFSDLLKVRKTQIRQFIFGSYITGINRILDRVVAVNGQWRDAAGRPPLGNTHVSLGFQTIYFLPWYVYGFQLAVYHQFTANILSADNILLERTLFLPSVELGARVLNDNLVIPSFSVGIEYFGKSDPYKAGWELKFETTLPNIFGSSQRFKPHVTLFN